MQVYGSMVHAHLVFGLETCSIIDYYGACFPWSIRNHAQQYFGVYRRPREQNTWARLWRHFPGGIPVWANEEAEVKIIQESFEEIKICDAHVNMSQFTGSHNVH
jgi:hypothetical protein